MRILVYGGWFGSRNLGDEAILQGVKVIIEKRLPEAELVALSTDPEYTLEKIDVHSEQIESPRSLIRNRGRYLELFREADAHLLTGGTPFYDYGHLSRIIHMGLPALSKKQVYCFGVGSKPIATLRGREITRMLMKNTALISTRDVLSKQILQPLTGTLVKPITVTGDSALMLNPMRSSHDEKKVLFCPRRLTEEHKLLYHQELDRATINRIRHMQAITADKLIDGGHSVLFLPFHIVPPDDDREEIRVISNLMHNEATILPRPDSTSEALKLIGGSALVVGLRLHSLIFAALQGTPFTSVDYDIKIRGFMEHMNAEEHLSETNMGLNRLYEKSNQLLRHRSQISTRLSKRVNSIRGLINAEADRLVSLLIERNNERRKPARRLPDTLSL